MKNNFRCFACGKERLARDEIGINKKMLNTKNKHMYCLDCLADYLEVTSEELLAKIEEFKEQGCKLF